MAGCPPLDINVLARAMEGGKDLGLETAAITVQQRAGKSGPAQLCDQPPELVARRESEPELLRRHLDRMPVSQNLPNTDAEAASIRDEVVATLDGLSEQRWHLIADVIARPRSLSDAFSLTDLDFMYASAGTRRWSTSTTTRSWASCSLRSGRTTSRSA